MRSFGARKSKSAQAEACATKIPNLVAVRIGKLHCRQPGAKISALAGCAGVSTAAISSSAVAGNFRGRQAGILIARLVADGESDFLMAPVARNRSREVSFES